MCCFYNHSCKTYELAINIKYSFASDYYGSNHCNPPINNFFTSISYPAILLFYSTTTSLSLLSLSIISFIRFSIPAIFSISFYFNKLLSWTNYIKAYFIGEFPFYHSVKCYSPPGYGLLTQPFWHSLRSL